MINLFNNIKVSTKLINILTRENQLEKDDSKTSISDISLKQNSKKDKVFLSYVCHYNNKNYLCVAKDIY